MPLSDIVFLEDNKVEDVIYCEEPYSLGSWFHAKHMDLIGLSQIGEALGVATYDELMDGFDTVIDPEGESIILYIPVLLQNKLRNITDHEINEVCEASKSIEDFNGISPPEDLSAYLRNLKIFLNSKDEKAYLYLSC